jgi:hypothetical protein
MAAALSHRDASEPRWRCYLTVGLLLAALSARAGADDWKFDLVTLKPGPGVREDGRILKGLLIDYQANADEVQIRVIHQEPGEPTRVEPPSFFKRSQVESVKTLDPRDRAVLERRVQLVSPAALRKRMDDLKLTPIEVDFGKVGKKRGFRFNDESGHFTLETNVNEEVCRRAAVRLIQVFNGYAHALAPRETSARPTTILLLGTQAEYQALLKERGLGFFNPAFYDPARNEIVCGSDLVRLGQLLEVARRENQKVAEALKQREDDLKKVYRGRKVPPEVMRPIDETRQQLAVAEETNARLFDEATRALFRRLQHESFHAYLANFVFVDERAELPRWLNEGLAQVFETALFEADEMRVGRPDPVRLRQARSARHLVPLPELLRGGPKQFLVVHASDKETSDRYYLTAWALAYYLVSDAGILTGKKLDDYCHATRAGDDPLAAFAALAGTKREDLPQFEIRFHASLQKR